METMAAAVLHDPNKPFTLEQVSKPQALGDDVLVRVRACGLVPNLGNVIHYNETLPFIPLPDFPAVFGLDPAGEIAAVGSEVAGLTVGQRVYVNPERACGSCLQCRKGVPMQCPAYTFAGYFGFGPESKRVMKRYPGGGYAEFMLAPSSSIVVLPDEVSFEEAARFGYLGTAYAALRRAQAGPDTAVLINGATGTLGVGAVMVALALGAPKVLAVARDKTRLAELQAIAPGRIVTHSNDDGPCTEWARAQTDGVGPDVMIEAIGPGTPPEVTVTAMSSVGKGGRIVTVGGSFDHITIDPIWFMLNQITYAGSLWFSTGQAIDMARMAASGALDLKSLKHHHFGLDQVTEALAASSDRAHGGFDNVVVVP